MAGPGFVPVSSFVPRFPVRFGVHPTTPARPASTFPRMQSASASSRQEEIKRLTEQLNQLRAKRQKAAETSSSASPPAQPAAPVPSPSPTPSLPSDLSFGKHGEQGRFLSIVNVEAEEYFPRTILIAGAVPGLSTEDFRKTPAMLYSKPPSKGNLFLSRIPDDFNGTFIALPGTSVLVEAGDPIAVLVEHQNISASKLPIANDSDVVVIVDRAVKSAPFDPRKFYAWDVDGHIHLGWVDELPPEAKAKMVGVVVYGAIDIEEALRQKKSCWEEENETYT